MEFLRRGRILFATGILLLAVLILAGCAPDANADIISPELGERMIAAASAGQVEAVEPTPAPMLVDLSPEEIVAGLSDEFIAALGTATPANGETLALTNGCIGCHALDPAATMTGPTWYNMGNTAVGRVAGESPAYYLHQSIVAPNEYVVSGYPQGIMPQTYADTLSEQDLADLVAYLLSQTE